MKKQINLAFYRQEDWNRLLSIVDDKEVFHETWEEWHRSYQATKRRLESDGLTVNEIVVDLDSLVRFCYQRGIKNDGKARSQFAAQALKPD